MTRRIIVAIDESAASHAALESAARLAAEISAEILGIFIEDVDMFLAAGVPGSSVVHYHDESALPLDESGLARSLRARARQLRGEVARMAELYRIPWSFETVRGRVSEEILRLAGSSEMIAIGTSSMRGRGIFGATAQAIVERAHCSVLVVRRQLPPAQRIVVLSGAKRAHEIGANLARTTGAHLIVQDRPTDRRAAFDLLMRLSPSYLVIDRPSLEALKVSARELAEGLMLEGLILADEGVPDAP